MNIEIKHKEEKDNGWNFLVIVSGSKFSVDLDKKYWQKLTEEKILPEELIKKSFQFLLKREPKEAILKKFNLKVISQYFPEYKEEISSEF